MIPRENRMRPEKNEIRMKLEVQPGIGNPRNVPLPDIFMMMEKKIKKNESSIEKNPVKTIILMGNDEEDKIVSRANLNFFLNVHLDLTLDGGRSNGINTGSKPIRNTSTIVEVLMG